MSVSASLPTVKQNDCVEIKTILNSSSVTLSSITYPSQETVYLDAAMTKNALTFNYTFCNTSILGSYYYDYYDAEGNVYVNDFLVTPNGLEQTQANAIGSLAFLLLMLVLMFTFGTVGFKLLKHETLWILGIFLVFFAVLILIYNTWLGYEYHHLFTGLPDSSVPETIFYIMLMILVLGLLSGVTLLILNWKKVFKYIKKEIKRKESDDRDLEDWDFDGNGKGGSYGN